MVRKHKKLSLFSLLIFCLFLQACGINTAMRAKIEYKELKISVDNPYPLIAHGRPGDGVYVEIRDATPFGIADHLKALIEENLIARGFQIVPLEAAKYNIFLYVRGSSGNKSAREVMGNGEEIGGALVGGTAGFLAGAQKGPVEAVVGGLVGVTAGAISDLASSMVKIGELDMNCHLSLTIKKQGPQGENKPVKMDNNFTVSAKKENLKWDECSTQVLEAIAREVANII